MIHRLFYILTLPLRAWHRRGFDVQSPWAYELVCDVLFEPLPYYAYDELHLLRESFPKEAAGCQCSADERLFRIANHFAPCGIVEIGSPVSACYLARPHTSATCTLITRAIDSKSKELLQRLDITTVTGDCLTLLEQHIRQTGRVGLLHISNMNGGVLSSDSVSDEVSHIYELAASSASASSVVIIDGIQKEKRHLWRFIVDADERATVTFDLGDCGVVTFDPKRVKQNYLL